MCTKPQSTPPASGGKHTPGTWQIVDGLICGPDPLQSPIALINPAHCLPPDECAANAALIASAPRLLAERDSLLAALRGMMELDRTWDIMQTNTSRVWTIDAKTRRDQCRRAARAAIALAEGGKD